MCGILVFPRIYLCSLLLVTKFFKPGIQWRMWQVSELPFRDVWIESEFQLNRLQSICFTDKQISEQQGHKFQQDFFIKLFFLVGSVSEAFCGVSVT